ncbi:hypothetical protein LEP1GSC126_2334 [Leptospira kirschneri str. 200801774]|nr:hypothetical protein LEP1GSC126_2334 [Leptospira kirschneri str. 200801774]
MSRPKTIWIRCPLFSYDFKILSKNFSAIDLNAPIGSSIRMFTGWFVFWR